MNEKTPKLFISYSWSNADHEQRVLKFAEDLMSQGIHVLFDKWDLQPGHDSNAFMESMVTDVTVTKVILVCDELYAQKSDGRKGGAGTEAQIITPEIYAQAQQDKFVAVIFDRDPDGKPYLPTYYKSRIYFDLSDPSNFGTEFDKIVRWAWGRQLFIKPEIGHAPKFVEETKSSGKISTSVAHRRALEAIRSQALRSAALVTEYLDTVAVGLESFRIITDEVNKETFDDLVIASIEDFEPYRNELIEIFVATAQYNASDEVIGSIHRFFEKCIPYFHPKKNTGSHYEWDCDNYNFIIHEAFLYCLGALLKFERFDQAAYFIDNEYYWNDRSYSESNMHTFVVFRNYMRSMDYRNTRLKKGHLSLRAELLNIRNQGTAVDFKFLMAADFILYLRAWRANEGIRWWPESLLYLGRYDGAFEMFARAKSNKYFSKLTTLLHVVGKDGFRKKIEAITAEPQGLPKWQFDSINPRALTGIDQIGTAT